MILKCDSPGYLIGHQAKEHGLADAGQDLYIIDLCDDCVELEPVGDIACVKVYAHEPAKRLCVFSTKLHFKWEIG